MDSQPGTTVSGATIIVRAEGDTIGRYVEKNKGIYYYEGAKFQEKRDYGLSIQHPDYTSASAKVTVPVVPECSFATYPENGRKVNNFTTYIPQVSLEFEDEVSTADFYIITATSSFNIIFRDYFYPDEGDSVFTHTNPAQINSKSTIIEMTFNRSSYKFAQNNIDWESYYRVSESELIFSDKLFNGQKATIPVDLVLFEHKNTTFVHLTLTAISKEYYQLLRSLAAYNQSERGFFPEAIQVYSNVHNGQGVWAAKSSKTISADVSDLKFSNE
jgi:hypothetical protein